MRFLALVKKELRESLRWIMLAVIIFGLIGSFIFWSLLYRPHHYYYWNQDQGEVISSNEFIRPPKSLAGIGPLLLGTSLVLGSILAAQHFGEQDKLKTWAFTIHRSVTRSTILWAKFSAAVITFVVSLGSIWTVFFLHALKQRELSGPVGARIFLEGWIFIVLGLVVYFGTVLAALSTKKQRVRICSLLFAAGLVILALVQLSLFYSFVVIVFGLMILLSQIFGTFLTREF